MESLNKQQIVLVALLVSFVTSIATGIVTVALMDQAPPGVTQTVNRVVEHTIEKVVPNPTQSASVVTKETVVVKEDDLVVSAIEKNTKNLVSIVKILGEGDMAVEEFAGNGLVVGKDGTIVTPAEIVAPDLDDNQNPIIRNFKAVFNDGSVVSIKFLNNLSTSNGFAIFKPELTEKVKVTVFPTATFSDSNTLKLGQAVIAMGGEKISVATGIVSNISGLTNTEGMASTTESVIKSSVIKTDIIAPSKSIGSVLVNLSGDVVGMRNPKFGSNDNLFISATLIPRSAK
jgi:hypothetical protein